MRTPKYVIITIIILNFLTPFFIILKNKNIDKREKMKMIIRACIVMGIISIISLLIVIKR